MAEKMEENYSESYVEELLRQIAPISDKDTGPDGMERKEVEHLTKEMAALATNPSNQSQVELDQARRRRCITKHKPEGELDHGRGQCFTSAQEKDSMAEGNTVAAKNHSSTVEKMDYPDKAVLVFAFLLAYTLGNMSTVQWKPPH